MDLTNPFAALSGRTAVVTGGAQGIGLTIAQTLTGVGMKVLVVDRDPAALSTVDDGIATVAADITVDGDWAGIHTALDDLPPLAAWVNNAGVVSHQRAEAVDITEFERVMGINTVGTLRGAQAAFTRMVDADGPHAIVNLASLVVPKVLPDRLTYAASKAALVSITRYMAQEWGPRGIRVNAVSPGYIDTRLTNWPDDDPRAQAKKQTLSTLALPRAGTQDDIAHAVLFLISDLSAYITGEVVTVDGGWHLI